MIAEPELDAFPVQPHPALGHPGVQERSRLGRATLGADLKL